MDMQSSDEELLCCRACLLTDCKLFDIHEYKLIDAFNRITGIPVKDARVLRYLCTYCHTRLLKCISFKETCQQTQKCLKSKLAMGELNIDEIRKIDRGSLELANLNVTPMETIDIEGQPNHVVAKKFTKNTSLRKANKNTFIDDTSDSDDDISDLSDTDLDDDSENEATAKDISLKKGDLKMELEVVKGELKFKIVPEANTKRTLKRKIKHIEDNSPLLTYQISHVPKKVQAPKKNKGHFKKKNTAQDLDENVLTNTDNEIVEFENLISDDENISTHDPSINSGDENISTLDPNVNSDDEVIPTHDPNINSDDEVIPTHDPNVNSDEINLTHDAASDVCGVPTSLSLAPKPSDEITDLPTPYNSPALKRYLRRREAIEKMEARKKAQPNPEPRKDLTPEEFELNYGVEIINLSKQEQREEIAERKRSAKYKEAEWKCEICGKAHSSMETYNNHRLRHDPRAGQFACRICTVRFPDRSSLSSHQVMHATKFVCKECGFVSRTREIARMHHEEHLGKKYICDYCGKTYGKRSSYFSHVRLVHPSEHAACDECGETFIGKGIEMHKKKSHPKNLQKHQCTVCSVNFLSLDALKRHVKTAGEHVGLSPCEKCGRNCASEEALQAHDKRRHQTEMYICNECEVSFSNAPAFELHFRRKHLGERPSFGKGVRRRERGLGGPVMCDQCPRIYKCEANLRYHQARKHSGPADFCCSECPKTCATWPEMKVHMRSHSEERPFQCPDCSMSFKLKYHLDRHHNRLHLGIHDHAECSLCGRVFTTRAGLRLHIDAVHHGVRRPRRVRNKVLVEQLE